MSDLPEAEYMPFDPDEFKRSACFRGRGHDHRGEQKPENRATANYSFCP